MRCCATDHSVPPHNTSTKMVATNVKLCCGIGCSSQIFTEYRDRKILTRKCIGGRMTILSMYAHLTRDARQSWYTAQEPGAGFTVQAGSNHFLHEH
jgi:hypothetical protein